MFLNLVDPIAQLMIIRADPGYFLFVLVNTILTNFQFYLESMVGLFGWRDTPMSSILMYGLIVFIGIVIFRVSQIQKLKIPFVHLIILTGILVGTVIAFFCHFYLHGTPVAYPIVDSMQGRYFLPMLPFALFILVQWASYMRKLRAIIAAVLILSTVVSLVNLFFARYYDYSTVFDDPLRLRDQVKNDEIIIKNFDSVYISSPSSYLYDVKNPDYKIGGFEVMTMENTHINRVAVPYRVSISDPTCTKEFWHGYLDQTELQSEHVVTVKTGIMSLPTSKVCLTFTPIVRPDESRFVTLAGIVDTPIVEFLYLKK